MVSVATLLVSRRILDTGRPVEEGFDAEVDVLLRAGDGTGPTGELRKNNYAECEPAHTRA
jgi:hypothetical protein